MDEMFNENNYRGDKEKKKGFNFKIHKDKTFKSLKEVNYFLCDFNRFFDYVTVYNKFTKR